MRITKDNLGYTIKLNEREMGHMQIVASFSLPPGEDPKYEWEKFADKLDRETWVAITKNENEKYIAVEARKENRKRKKK